MLRFSIESARSWFCGLSRLPSKRSEDFIPERFKAPFVRHQRPDGAD